MLPSLIYVIVDSSPDCPPTRIWALWKLSTLSVLFIVISSELKLEDSYNWHLINICWSHKWLMIMHLFLLIIFEVGELGIIVYLVSTHWFLEVHKRLTVLNRNIYICIYIWCYIYMVVFLLILKIIMETWVDDKRWCSSFQTVSIMCKKVWNWETLVNC